MTAQTCEGNRNKEYSDVTLSACVCQDLTVMADLSHVLQPIGDHNGHCMMIRG